MCHKHQVYVHEKGCNCIYVTMGIERWQLSWKELNIMSGWLMGNEIRLIPDAFLFRVLLGIVSTLKISLVQKTKEGLRDCARQEKPSWFSRNTTFRDRRLAIKQVWAIDSQDTQNSHPTQLVARTGAAEGAQEDEWQSYTGTRLCRSPSCNSFVGI